MMKNKRKPLMLLLATLCVTAVSGMTACFDKLGSSQEENSSVDSSTVSTESVSTDVEDSSSMVESEENSSSVADEESSSAGDSEDSSSSVVEKVAPTITFASDVTNLVGNVGETVEIPKVIVESEEEYGLLVMLADATTKGIVFEEKAGDAGTYLLTSDVAGDIRIGYIAYLTEDDTVESQEIVTVKINPVKAETVVPEEEGLGEYPTAVAKINAAEEGETVVFTENFEKGYGSQFTAWTEYTHTNSAGSPTPYLIATEDAITGNSWVLDYTGLKRTGESMIFTELGSIIRQGAWKIEFDVRALSGSLNKNAQFCIFPVGQDVAYRWEFAVTSEVTHVTIDIGTKNFIDANSAAFNVGSDDYSNLKIVLDNFRVTYTKVTYPVSEPEGMQVRLSADENWKNTELSEAEVVIDGNNGGTWSSLSGSGSPVWVDRDALRNTSIITEEQKQAMTAENGFGDNVIYLIGQNNLIEAFVGGFTMQNFYKGDQIAYKMRIEMKVIGSTNGWTFLVGGQGVATTVEGDGIVKTVIWEGVPTSAFQEVWFYNGGVNELFVGEIKVTREEVIDARVEPDNLVTAATNWVDNKIVLNTTADNLTAITPSSASFAESGYVDRNKIVGAKIMSSGEYDKAFAADSGFAADSNVPVLYLNGSQTIWFNALDNLFTDVSGAYSYKITISGYVLSASNWHLWRSNSGTSYGQFADGSSKFFTETKTITPTEDFTQCGLYVGGNLKAFISSIVVERIPTVTVTPNNLVKNAEWADNKIVLNTTADNLTAYEAVDQTVGISYVDVTKLVAAGRMDQATYEANFTAKNGFNTEIPVLYIVGNGMMSFSALDGLFKNEDKNYEYKITVKGFAVTASNCHLFHDGNWGSFGQMADTTNGMFNETFDLSTGYDRLGFYAGGSMELYIASIEVVRTKIEVNPNVTPENLVNQAEWVDNKIVLNTTVDNLTAFKDADGRFAINYVDTSKLAEAGKLDQATLDANFTAANGFNTAIPVLYVKGGGAFWFSALDGLFVDGESYEYQLTIKGFAVQAANVHLWTNKGHDIRQIADTNASKPSYVFAETVTLPTGMDNFGFYAGGSMELYIASIEVVRTVKEIPAVDPSVTPENLLTSAEWVDNKIVLNTTNSNLTAYTDKDGNCSSIGYVDASKLVEAGRMSDDTFNANFTSANGYNAGVPVFYAKGSGFFYFNALDGLFANYEGYTYKVTIKGYAAVISNVHFFTRDTWASMKQLAGTESGYAFSETFDMPTGHPALGIYAGGNVEIYVYSIEVVRTKVLVNPNVTPENLVSQAEWADNKIVLNTTADNLTAFKDADGRFEINYVDTSKLAEAGKLDQATLDANFTAANGFNTTIPVLYVKGGGVFWFSALDGLFVDGESYEYQLTIKGFAVQAANVHLWTNKGHDIRQIADTNESRPYYAFSETVTLPTGMNNFGFYAGGSMELYIASIEVVRTVKEIPAVDPSVTPENLLTSAEWVDNKIVLNTTNSNLTAYTDHDGKCSNIGYVDASKLVEAGRMSDDTFNANFTSANGYNAGVPVFYAKGSGFFYFNALDGLFAESAGYTYKVTVKGYAASINNCHMFTKDTWQSIKQFGGTESGYAFSETFDMPAGHPALGIYAGGSIEIYVYSIEVVRTKVVVNPNVTPENLVSQAEWVDNKIVLNTTNSNLTAYTDHDGRCTSIGYVDASKLVDAGMLDQTTFDSNFTAANGYSEGVPVFYANGSGFFYFNALNGLFQNNEGYTYKVTIKGYAAFVNDGHMFTRDTWKSVKQFAGTESGYAFSETFDMPTGHPALGILGNQSIEIYVFSLEVERTKVIVNPNVTPENLLTKAEWVDNKIVLNTTNSNLTAFKDADGRFEISYVDTSKLAEAGMLDQAKLDANFTAANGFNTAIPVLHVKGGGAFWFSALDGLFSKDEGYTYSLTIKGYAVQVSNSHLWSNNGGVGKQIGDTSNGYVLNETISLPIGIKNFGFYAGGSMELYIASVEVVRTEKVVPEVDVNVTPENLLTSAEWVDNKIVLNTTNSNLTAIEDWDKRYGNEGNSIGYVDASKLVEAGKMDQATFDANFTAENGYTEGVPVFYVKGTGLFLFKALDNLLNDDAYTYQMTIKGYAVNNSYVLLFTHGNWQQIGQFGDTSTGKVVNNTFTFDAIGSSSMGINGISNIEMYIFSIEVVRIAK